MFILKEDNENSIVLKITSSYFSILLTGDIEEKAMAFLEETYNKRLSSTILKYPHHAKEKGAITIESKGVGFKVESIVD